MKQIRWMLAAILFGSVCTSAQAQSDNTGNGLDPKIVERRHCHAMKDYFNDFLNLQFEQIVFEYTSVGPDLTTPVRLTASISMPTAVYEKTAQPRALILYSEPTTAKHRERSSQDQIDDMGLYLNCIQNFVIIAPDLYGWTNTEDKPQAYTCPEINAVESIDAWDAAMVIMQQEGYKHEELPLFNVGYSAAGFTAMAVQKYISEKRTDLHFDFTAAGAAPFDITTVYENYVKTNFTGYKCALPLMMVAYKETYNLPFEYQDVFLPPLCDNIQEWILSKDFNTWEINERIGLEASVDEILTPAACDYTQGIGRTVYEKFRDNSLCGPWCDWQPDTDTKYFIFHSTGDLYMHYFVSLEMANYLTKMGCDVDTDFNNWGNHVDYALPVFTFESMIMMEELIDDALSGDIIDNISDNMDKVDEIADEINNDGGGEITSINDEARAKSREVSDVWFTLDGQQLSEKPQRGIYIHQGNTVVIR